MHQRVDGALHLLAGPRSWSCITQLGSFTTKSDGQVMSVILQVFGRRHDEPFHALWQPASKKRECTKSREVWHRRCSGRYGDLMAVPSWRVDVTPTG
jgi:hypothetical protein